DCAAGALDFRATTSAALGIAQRNSPLLDFAARSLEAATGVLRLDNASAGGMGYLYRSDLVVALTANLWSIVGKRRFAQTTACVLFAKRPDFLVSGRAAVSGPAQLVGVALGSLFTAGRYSKHAAFGLADIFRSAALSVLPSDAPSGRHFGARRPSR